MAGIGVVIVSHSAKLEEGLAEIVEEMNDGSVKVIATGGADGGRIGTSAIKIQDAIESLEDCKNILIYAYIGISIISAETAIDMLDDDLQERVHMVDCPIVEGAFAGVVQATITDDPEEIMNVSKSAKELCKC